MSDPGEHAGAVPWRVDLRERLRRLSLAATVGLLCGAVIGGVGGRLAMLLLRLTSDAAVRGLKTDDDFVIGRFSGDTAFLVALATVVGGLAGALYLVVRLWLPERRRWLWMGALAGLMGGSAIVHPGGVDFTRLDPLWLAIALFVVIPGAFGAATSALVERRLARAPAQRGRWAWLGVLVLIPLMATGPAGLLVLLVFAATFVLHRQVPELSGAARSPVGMALGRAALLAVATLAAVDLVRDAQKIL